MSPNMLCCTASLGFPAFGLILENTLQTLCTTWLGRPLECSMTPALEQLRHMIASPICVFESVKHRFRRQYKPASTDFYFTAPCLCTTQRWTSFTLLMLHFTLRFRTSQHIQPPCIADSEICMMLAGPPALHCTKHFRPLNVAY